jgi:signal peptidase II
MTYNKRLLLIAIILLSCVGCDKISKAAAQKHWAFSQSSSYLDDVVRFQYTENRGAFLGFGSVLPNNFRFLLLIGLTGIVVAGMLAFVLIKPNLYPVVVLTISLIAVIDFMNIGVGRFRTGIFNIADVAIMTGMGMLILTNYKYSRLEETPSNGLKKDAT